MAKVPESLPLPELAAGRQRRSWTFRAAVVVLVGLSAYAVLERNPIRAYWWAWQLTRTDDPVQQAYYLGSLAAVGDAATDAVERLAHDERPEVRSLSVIALARLPAGHGVSGLRELMNDEDPDIVEFAANSLSFMEGEPAAKKAQRVLLDAAGSDDSRVAAAAAAALSRVQTGEAVDALCKAVRNHADAQVRAQAVESLAACLESAHGARHALPVAGPAGDPLAVLIGALNDRGEFTGGLSLERQIAAVASFANSRGQATQSQPAGPSLSAGRTVADVAADNLERLIGKSIEPRETWSDADLAQLLKDCREMLQP